jgi:hypothetical protein
MTKAVEASNEWQTHLISAARERNADPKQYKTFEDAWSAAAKAGEVPTKQPAAHKRTGYDSDLDAATGEFTAERSASKAVSDLARARVDQMISEGDS